MGLLRLFLALSVIAGHANSTIFGFKGLEATYAVNFFFIISGFYMAMVLNEKYKDTRPIDFYKSRALRLFPTYYIGACLALLVSFRGIGHLFENLTLSSKFFYVFQNVFIFGQDFSYLICAKFLSNQCASPIALTINPPAWSLAVELSFYLVAPFILKSEKKTFAYILFGCAYLLLINEINFPLESADFLRTAHLSAFNYYFYPSSFIFFGGGALAYHLSKKSTEPHYFFSVLTVIGLSFTITIMPFWHMIFFSMAIPVLFKFTAKNRLDRAIGEMSYPAYILHYPIMLGLSSIAKSHPQYFKFISFGSWVAILSCILGLVIYFVVEKKINSYREFNFSSKSGVKLWGNNAIRFFSAALIAYFIFPLVVIGYIYVFQSEVRPTYSKLTDREQVEFPSEAKVSK